MPRLAGAAHVVRPWPGDKDVPSLELADLAGRQWTLGALRGQVVLLNFWATWCEPCRDEMPSLEAFAASHRHAGITVLSVNYHESVETIRAFLALRPFTLPVLLDVDGDAATAWTPRVFPSTVLIDRGGRPVSTVLGEMDWSAPAAHALVEPLLARRRGA